MQSTIMTTRHQQLRQTIANLAAPAETQKAHLQALFGGDIGPEFCVDELAFEFGDYYSAAHHMMARGEITQAEFNAVKPVDALLARWSGKANADFWTVRALFSDPHWEEVRVCARQALDALTAE